MANGRKATSFMRQLVKMITECDEIHFDGGTLIIPSPAELEKRLPDYYRTAKLASFQRQLNNFGYHRSNVPPEPLAPFPNAVRYRKVTGGETVTTVEGLLSLRPLARRKRDREYELPPVLKYVDARECRGASAAARARTVGSYANELAVLRDLSGVFAAARVWTPRVLACETDGDRYLVALEALLPPAFAQRPTLPAEHCVQALRWLARFHAFGHRLAASGFGDLGVWPLGGHTPLAHRPPGEVEGLERGYDRWLLAFCDEKRFRVPPNDFGARLAAQARRVDGWIADACGPRRTLVHGDFKAGNLFVEDATRRVFAIDWQWCGWGCGLHDVVYFFATTAADDFVKDFDDALWLYHYALVEELEPELRAAAPWPYPETRRLFMLAALDYVRWCFAYRLVDETPGAYKRRAAAEPRDVNQGEYRRSFRRLRYLCDLAEQFLPYAESGALGVSLQDLALLDL